MEKIKIDLVDILASHSLSAYGFRSMTPFTEPSLVEWTTGIGTEVVVFTDKSFHLAERNIFDDKIKIAWLVESRAIHNYSYEKILECESFFDYIFTFDEQLLARGEKYIKSLIGSTRIMDKHAGIYKKNKLVSLIASKKNFTEGHKLRHDIVGYFTKGKNYPIDLWGEAYRPMPEGYKIMAQAQYAYTIAVENANIKNYFTEKIIDCFRTGTIPIYWGCDEISEYFNMDGVIVFNTVSELEDVLDKITLEEYEKRLPSIKENFELAKEWISMDDTFTKNLNEKVMSR